MRFGVCLGTAGCAARSQVCDLLLKKQHTIESGREYRQHRSVAPTLRHETFYTPSFESRYFRRHGLVFASQFYHCQAHYCLHSVLCSTPLRMCFGSTSRNRCIRKSCKEHSNYSHSLRARCTSTVPKRPGVKPRSGVGKKKRALHCNALGELDVRSARG
jgi:hypothetical protein